MAPSTKTYFLRMYILYLFFFPRLKATLSFWIRLVRSIAKNGGQTWNSCGKRVFMVGSKENYGRTRHCKNVKQKRRAANRRLAAVKLLLRLPSSKGRRAKGSCVCGANDSSVCVFGSRVRRNGVENLCRPYCRRYCFANDPKAFNAPNLFVTTVWSCHKSVVPNRPSQELENDEQTGRERWTGRFRFVGHSLKKNTFGLLFSLVHEQPLRTTMTRQRFALA